MKKILFLFKSLFFDNIKNKIFVLIIFKLMFKILNYKFKLIFYLFKNLYLLLYI